MTQTLFFKDTTIGIMKCGRRARSVANELHVDVSHRIAGKMELFTKSKDVYRVKALKKC